MLSEPITVNSVGPGRKSRRSSRFSGLTRWEFSVGELWWVRDGSVYGLIPQRHGPPAVYPWETSRFPGEPWLDFVERCAHDALAAVERFPEPGDLPPDLAGRILYNLVWVSETEFEELTTKAG
jgi:hypothetical protein